MLPELYRVWLASRQVHGAALWTVHQMFKGVIWIVSEREIVALLGLGDIPVLPGPGTCFKQMHFLDALEITWV